MKCGQLCGVEAKRSLVAIVVSSVMPLIGKDTVHSRKCHEGPEGEYRCSSTLSLTPALYGVGVQRHAPPALSPGKRTGTQCIGGWVGP